LREAGLSPIEAKPIVTLTEGEAEVETRKDK
jgi:hypothetical protein